MGGGYGTAVEIGRLTHKHQVTRPRAMIHSIGRIPSNQYSFSTGLNTYRDSNPRTSGSRSEIIPAVIRTFIRVVEAKPFSATTINRYVVIYQVPGKNTAKLLH